MFLRSLIIAALLALLMGFAGCKPEPQTPYALVVHWVSDPGDLHPTNRRTASAGELLGLTHQTLVEFSAEDNAMIPLLAESWTQSPDGLIYTYLLHKSASWPDGTPVKASDVVFSYKAIMCPLTQNENQKDYLEYVASVEVDPENDRAVIFRAREFYINNPYLGTLALILDPRKYDPDHVLDAYSFSDLILKPDTVAKDPRIIAWAAAFNDPKNGHDPQGLDGGTGPYRLVSWQTEESLTLEKRENYWAKASTDENLKQGPAQIIFKIVKDENAVALQLMSGEMDLSTSLSTPTYLSLLAEDSVDKVLLLDMFPRNTVSLMGLNNRPDKVKFKPFFDDVRVRKAMAFACPVDTIVAQVSKGMAVRTASPVPPSHPDYSKSLKPVAYDLAQARTLLDSAGWIDSDGNGIRDKVVNGRKIQFSFELKYPAGQKTMDLMVAILKQSYASVGIECRSEASTDIAQAMRSHSFDAVLTAFGAPSTPYDFKQLWHSTNWPKGDNFFGYYNLSADSLIDLARSTPDARLRQQYVKDAQAIIYEDQPVVFFSSPTEKLAFSKKFEGTTVHKVRPYIYLNAVVEGPRKP